MGRTFWSALAAQGIALRVVKAVPISLRTRSHVLGGHTAHTDGQKDRGVKGTEAVKAGEKHKKKQRKSRADGRGAVPAAEVIVDLS